MTLAELIERLQWLQSGKLETRRPFHVDEWIGCTTGGAILPNINDPADIYRRRPDPPPMPDEVWLPNLEPTPSVYCAVSEKPSRECTRYIRAGAVIPASQMEWKTRNSPEWMPACGLEYRIKP